MATTARATYEPRRRYEREVPARPNIEVHEGRGRRLDEQNARMMSMFKLAVLVVALVAVVAVGRVWFTDASMDVLTQTSVVQSQIEDAQAKSAQLEVQYYAITSPSRIKAYASQMLGMVASGAPETTVSLAPGDIDVGFPAVVATATQYNAQRCQLMTDTANGTIATTVAGTGLVPAVAAVDDAAAADAAAADAAADDAAAADLGVASDEALAGEASDVAAADAA